MGYKNKKMRENKILYTTLYRDSGVSIPEDKSNRAKDRAAIKRIMDEWVSVGLLKSFYETKKGNNIDGIVFEIATNKSKEKAG